MFRSLVWQCTLWESLLLHTEAMSLRKTTLQKKIKWKNGMLIRSSLITKCRYFPGEWYLKSLTKIKAFWNYKLRLAIYSWFFYRRTLSTFNNFGSLKILKISGKTKNFRKKKSILFSGAFLYDFGEPVIRIHHNFHIFWNISSEREVTVWRTFLACKVHFFFQRDQFFWGEVSTKFLRSHNFCNFFDWSCI